MQQDAEANPAPAPLVAGCLFQHLSELFQVGNTAADLLRLPGALPLLAQGLEGPATRNTDEQLHPSVEYLRHVLILEQLCQWTATVLGLQGLERIAKDLARPMVAALDYVFALAEQGGLVCWAHSTFVRHK
jgi:hypothetical protein